jgi:hypothetical protein
MTEIPIAISAFRQRWLQLTLGIVCIRMTAENWLRSGTG